MKNGTVILVARDPSKENLLFKILGAIIEWRTGSPYTHSGIYVGGYFYDDTIWIEKGKLHSGVRERTEWIDTMSLVREEIVSLTELQAHDLWKFCSWYSQKEFPYNIAQLAAFLFIYPLRPFLERIGWTPFQKTVDSVCSTFIGVARYYAGLPQIVKNQPPEFDVPGDYAATTVLRTVKQ